MTMDFKTIGYYGSPLQNEKLVAAVKKVTTTPGLSLYSLKYDCEEWWADNHSGTNGKKWTVSQATLHNLSKGRIPKIDSARILYGFLSRGWTKATLITEDGLGGILETDDDRFADAILKRFGRYPQRPYENLFGLTSLPEQTPSYWEAYRPSWRTGGEGHVIRSLVKIEQRGNGFWFTEKQSFSFRGSDIYEVDNGFIFPFAMSIACISTSGDEETDFNGVCMKMYSFTGRDPEPSLHSSTETMQGTVMAISNQGPHWSGPIYLIRKDLSGIGTLEHQKIAIYDKHSDPRVRDAMTYLREKENVSHLPPRP